MSSFVVTISWYVWDWSAVLFLKLSSDKCTSQGDHLETSLERTAVSQALGVQLCHLPRHTDGASAPVNPVLSLKKHMGFITDTPRALTTAAPTHLTLALTLTLWLPPHLSYYMALSWVFHHMVLFPYLDMNSKVAEILWGRRVTATEQLNWTDSTLSIQAEIQHLKCWLILAMSLLEWAALSPSIPHTARYLLSMSQLLLSFWEGDQNQTPQFLCF